MIVPHYYINARMNRKTALLAGPFFIEEQAHNLVDVVGGLFIAADGRNEAATFGVMTVNNHAGLGLYNIALKAGGVDIEVPNA